VVLRFANGEGDDVEPPLLWDAEQLFRRRFLVGVDMSPRMEPPLCEEDEPYELATNGCLVILVGCMCDTHMFFKNQIK